MISFTVLFLIVCVAVATALPGITDIPIFKTWRMGRKQNVDVTPTVGGVAMIGGGPDCDEAFQFMTGNSNGGDFVVLRASGDDAYNPYVLRMAVAAGKPLNSVTTILMLNRAASFDPEVIDILNNADGIFFAGGDQSVYLTQWMNTPVQKIVQEKMMNNVPIGGTSAGLAIQGQFIYTAENDTVTSQQAMSNPYDPHVTLAPPFLNIPFLETVFTDSHFVTRDRMGRLLTFLARELKDFGVPVGQIRGVGIDETTALILDIKTGTVKTVGDSIALICTPAAMAEVCEEDTPLTFKQIDCLRLNASMGSVYSFASFRGDSTVAAYTNIIVDGEFLTLPYGTEVPCNDDDEYNPGGCA